MEELKIGTVVIYNGESTEKMPLINGEVSVVIKITDDYIKTDRSEILVHKSFFHVLEPKNNGDFISIVQNLKRDPINPEHYGSSEDIYEPIKVINAWNLGFNLGNVVKYIARLGKKDEALTELKKARKYLDYEIQKLEKL